MFRNPRTWVGAAVSLVFLGLLLRQVDGAHVVEALRQADVGLLVLGLPCYLVGVWFRTVRWRQLMAPLTPAGSRALFRYVAIGYMANNTLPMRVGEVIRAYLAGRRFQIPTVPILSTIALERVSDGLVLVGFLALSALVAPLAGWMGQALLAMAVLFLGAILGLGVAAAAPGTMVAAVMVLMQRLPARPRDRIQVLVLGALDGLAVLRQPARLAAVTAFATLCWVAEAGVFAAGAAAFGLDLPWYTYVIAMAMANLATSLPSSQAGIGPFEYFCALSLTAFGAAPAVATAYALAVHAVLLIPVTAIGLAFLGSEGMSLAGLTRAARLAPRPPRVAPIPPAGDPS